MELSGSPLESVVALTSLVQRPLLKVRNLSVRLLVNSSRDVTPVNDVCFDIQSGEVVGLLGESGAGKTTLALALMCLLSEEYEVSGSIEFEGRELLTLDRNKLRKLRGARLSLVYQDSSVLNPVLRVGTQLTEILRAHTKRSRKECRDRAVALLEGVELRDAERILSAYPHQLSGGQRQRVVIAQALACNPVLIIADEPTASLDPAVAQEVLELLGRLRQRFQTSFLLITHDLSSATFLAGRVMVMYAGRIVEEGPLEEVLRQPMHPYAKALLECALPLNPSPGVGFSRMLAPTIPGPSEPMRSVHGCDFETRCQDRMSICGLRVPQPVELSPVHAVRCLKFGG